MLPVNSDALRLIPLAALKITAKTTTESIPKNNVVVPDVVGLFLMIMLPKRLMTVPESLCENINLVEAMLSAMRSIVTDTINKGNP